MSEITVKLCGQKFTGPTKPDVEICGGTYFANTCKIPDLLEL